MTRLFLLASIALFPFAAVSGVTSLDPDGGLRLDGERWFPLGMYEIPKDATRLELFVDAGFDLFRASATQASLDTLAEKNVQAWIPLGGYSEVPDSTKAAMVREHIAPLKDHPALALWEHPDEALWNVRQFRLDKSDKEREELRKLTNNWIRSGSPEVEAIKELYRDMSRAHAYQDYPALEEAMRDLWAALGHPDKKLATTFTAMPEREAELYDNLLAGYRLLRKEDPKHLVWQNHAPRNSADLLAKHAAYCDLIGCDIYPCPDNPRQGHSDLIDTRLTAAGAYTKRFRDIAPEKATFMVLQGFGWKHLHDMGPEYEDTIRGREPKFRESRFMAYDSIVNGAKGIAYWGTPYDPEGKAVENLVPVIQELASLQTFLAAPESKATVEIHQVPSWFSIEAGVLCAARQVGEDWLFIFVNEDPNPQEVRIKFPKEVEGKRLFVLYEDLAVDVPKEGLVELGFIQEGVRILSTKRELEVYELRGLPREINEPFPR